MCSEEAHRGVANPRLRIRRGRCYRSIDLSEPRRRLRALGEAEGAPEVRQADKVGLDEVGASKGLALFTYVGVLLLAHAATPKAGVWSAHEEGRRPRRVTVPSLRVRSRL